MKIYLVTRTDKIDYDEYDSWVVVAPNEKRARELCTGDAQNHPVTIEEIKLDKEQYILGSFNAG